MSYDVEAFGKDIKRILDIDGKQPVFIDMMLSNLYRHAYNKGYSQALYNGLVDVDAFFDSDGLPLAYPIEKFKKDLNHFFDIDVEKMSDKIEILYEIAYASLMIAGYGDGFNHIILESE